jgi:hypothetical protein
MYIVHNKERISQVEPRLMAVESTEERFALFGLSFLTVFTKKSVTRRFSLVPAVVSAVGCKVPDALRITDEFDIGFGFS